jgi:hypothetical protein
MARQHKQASSEAGKTTLPVKPLFERAAGYLDANGWHYTAHEDKTYFSAQCSIKDGSVRVILDVDESEEWQRVLVYSCFPVFVPELRRSAVAEAIARINFGMAFGNLELDLADGEVRVRTVIESDGAIGDPMIERALTSNLATADRFFSPILAVAFGNTAPEKAIELAGEPGKSTVQ